MKSKGSTLLLMLAVFYSVALVVSNIIAGKLFTFLGSSSGIVLTAGVWLFPCVYILDDVIPEIYGYSVTRRIILTAFFVNLIAVLFFLLTIALPYPPYFKGQDAFATVLGFTPRLLIASFTAYLVGTNVNAWILVKVKKMTKARFLWVRTISSTLVGESLDSAIFITIAFLGIIPTAALPGMIFTQAAFKIMYEILATPLTYAVVTWTKKTEGLPQNSTGFLDSPEG